MRLPPPQRLAQHPACPRSSGCFPDGSSPCFPPLQTPQKWRCGAGAPASPHGPLQARGGSGSTSLWLRSPAPTLRPWSLPRKNNTSGWDATGVTLSEKKEGFASTSGARVCNQNIQAGFRLDCTLDPSQAMGRILLRISAVQTPARRFQGSSPQVSSEGAVGEPRSPRCPLPGRWSWRGAGGSRWQQTGSVRAPAARLRRWHELGAALLNSTSNGC